MNTPWKLVQKDKWPFDIEIIDSTSEQVLQQGRYAYSSKDNTVEDVLQCLNHSPEDREACSEANRKQLAQLRHIVDCVNTRGDHQK